MQLELLLHRIPHGDENKNTRRSESGPVLKLRSREAARRDQTMIVLIEWGSQDCGRGGKSSIGNRSDRPRGIRG